MPKHVNSEGQELFVGQRVTIKDWRLDDERPSAQLSHVDLFRLPLIGLSGYIISLEASDHWRSPILYLYGLPFGPNGFDSSKIIWLGRWVSVSPPGLKGLLQRYKEEVHGR